MDQFITNTQPVDQRDAQNLRYRMPYEYGPSCGPRRGPNGEYFESRNNNRRTASVGFVTDEKKLAALLPPNCSLVGDPVMQIEHVFLTDVEWLAGRSYSLLAVNFNVRYEGSGEVAVGKCRSMLWENRCEPIITGREELGMAKIYCELPPSRVLNGHHHYSGVWEGHAFFDMELWDLKVAELPAPSKSDGLMFHRYIPGLKPSDPPAVDEMVITQSSGREFTTVEFLRGKGAVKFSPATWEQMPTMFHIVNLLADLPVLEVRSATYHQTVGIKDIDDIRRLA